MENSKYVEEIFFFLTKPEVHFASKRSIYLLIHTQELKKIFEFIVFVSTKKFIYLYFVDEGLLLTASSQTATQSCVEQEELIENSDLLSNEVHFYGQMKQIAFSVILDVAICRIIA